MSRENLLKFGRPVTGAEAVYRIPDISHPDYQISGGPHEHCAHFREFILENFIKLSLAKSEEKISLGGRMCPLLNDDIKLLREVNSFYLDDNSDFIVNWGNIETSEKSPWAEVLPVGDKEYCYWRISKLDPGVSFFQYSLYCIEMNPKFDTESNTRRNSDSEYEMVFATDEEIKTLKDELVRFQH